MSDNPADDFEDGISAVRDADLGGDAVTGNEIAEPQQTTSGKTINIKIDIMKGEGHGADWWHRIPSPLDIRIETGATIQQLKTRIQAISRIAIEEMEVRFNGEPMQDGGKLRHYGIKNGFHLVLGLSRVGDLQKQVRIKDRQLWERDFDHFDDMQEIRGMSFPSLVEDIELSHDPDRLGATCKLAFLTEAQAASCIDEMDHFVACLKLRRPKLILKFMGSYGDSNDLTHSYEVRHTQFPFVACVPEVSVGDQSKVEEHLIKFVQDCILDLAKNTNAIVIIEATANCGLAAAVRKVLGPVRDQMGDKCPFSLIGITSVSVVASKSALNHTNASRVKHGVLRKNGKPTTWKMLDEIVQRKSLAGGPMSNIDFQGNEDEQSVASKSKSNMGSALDLGGNVTGNGEASKAGDMQFYEEGQRVEAQYYKFDKWYPGRIAKTYENGTYDIDYDDGEKEWGVESKYIRLVQIERRKIKGEKTLQLKAREVDLGDGLSHYFIIEGDENKSEFEKRFLTVVTANTPALCFQTYGVEDDMKALMDICHRGLPLILLDSRERFWTSPMINPNDTKTYLAVKALAFDHQSIVRKLEGGLNLKVRERPKEDYFVAEQALKQHLEYLGAAGIIETYNGSTLAFLHAVLNPGKTTAPLDAVNPRGTLKLYEAIRVAGKKRKLDQQRGTADERADVKIKLELVMRMWEYSMRYSNACVFHGIMPKLQWWVAPFAAPLTGSGRPASRQHEMPGLNAQLNSSSKPYDNDTIRTDNEEGIAFAELIDEENFGVPAAWVREEESRRKYTPEGGPQGADVILKETCKNLYGNLREWQTTVGEHMEKWQPIPERVLNANKVITADTVYSASIFDHDAIHTVIKKVCDVDHLPDTTTYESLLLMRDAWDAVDIYVYLARWYKLLTHILYTIFLSVAVIIVLGTISQMRTRVENHEVYGQDVKVDDDDYELQQWFGKDEDAHDRWLRDGVLGFSLILLATGTIILIYNPMGRWHGLRSAALQTESEIFKFRCRAGPYKTKYAQAHRRGNRDGKGEPEMLLRSQIVAVRQQVVGSDLLKTAALNQKYKSQIYKHGQHAPNPGCMREFNDFCLVYCACCCNDPNDFEYHIEEGHSLMLPDFHFAPMRPKDYVCHRIDAILNFYDMRVGRYARVKFIINVLIILGALCCVLLAAMGFPEWAAAVVAIILATYVWSEFHGTSRKINRYSSTITELKNIKTWWFSLDQREQMIAHNCDKLVMMAEAAVSVEHRGWASESKIHSVYELSEDVAMRSEYTTPASGDQKNDNVRPASAEGKREVEQEEF